MGRRRNGERCERRSEVREPGAADPPPPITTIRVGADTPIGLGHTLTLSQVHKNSPI